MEEKPKKARRMNGKEHLYSFCIGTLGSTGLVHSTQTDKTKKCM